MKLINFSTELTLRWNPKMNQEHISWKRKPSARRTNTLKENLKKYTSKFAKFSTSKNARWSSLTITPVISHTPKDSQPSSIFSRRTSSSQTLFCNASTTERCLSLWDKSISMPSVGLSAWKPLSSKSLSAKWKNKTWRPIFFSRIRTVKSLLSSKTCPSKTSKKATSWQLMKKPSMTWNFLTDQQLHISSSQSIRMEKSTPTPEIKLKCVCSVATWSTGYSIARRFPTTSLSTSNGLRRKRLTILIPSTSYTSRSGSWKKLNKTLREILHFCTRLSSDDVYSHYKWTIRKYIKIPTCCYFFSNLFFHDCTTIELKIVNIS